MSDESETLIEYKAGRMNMVGKRIEPEERRGLIYLRRYMKDNQIHFCWADRKTGHIEVDIVAKPGLLEFRRIEQCKTGRVYVLRFQQSTRRLFFWLQEPQHQNDEQFCIQVNQYLLGPHVDGTIDPSKPSTAGTEERSGGGGNDIPTEDQYIFYEGQYKFVQEEELVDGTIDPCKPSTAGTEERSGGGGNDIPTEDQYIFDEGRYKFVQEEEMMDGTIDPSEPSTAGTEERSGGGGNDIPREDQCIFGEERYKFVQKEMMDLWTTPNDGQLASQVSQDISEASCLPSSLVQSWRTMELVDSPIIDTPFVDLGLALQMHGESAVSTLAKSNMRLRALLAQLPQDDDKPNDPIGSSLYIEEHLRSPQFYEAFVQFSIGLEAGVLSRILEPFHLDAEAMAAVRLGDLELFLRVLHRDKKLE